MNICKSFGLSLISLLGVPCFSYFSVLSAGKPPVEETSLLTGTIQGLVGALERESPSPLSIDYSMASGVTGSCLQRSSLIHRSKSGVKLHSVIVVSASEVIQQRGEALQEAPNVYCFFVEH